MTQPIPTNHEGLIPHLVCDRCSEAIKFYKKAFGAEEVSRVPSPDGKRIMHAETQIGRKPVFLVDDFPEFCGGRSYSPNALGGTPVTIHRFVEDCDAAIQCAQEAGATIKMPPADMFWGDRYGIVMTPSAIPGRSRRTCATSRPNRLRAGCRKRSRMRNLMK
jgi:PhnB protein